MAMTRVLRTASTPIHLASSPSTNASFSCSSFTSSLRFHSNKTTLKASLPASDHLITSQPVVVPRGGFSHLTKLASNIGRLMNSLVLTTSPVKSHPCNSQPQMQMLVEKAIIDCRFLTLFAVLGSLLGSVLCFIEGCFLVIQSYVQYFHILSKTLDQGHVVKLLIEAIDMFLVGTAMLIFGVGLYVMFVRSKTEKEPWLSGSNLPSLFYMKSTPRWVPIQSIGQAKSKIGHAMMLILQVGVLEKLKDVPIVTGFDLACFAGAILTSSVCIFLLSRLHR